MARRKVGGDRARKSYETRDRNDAPRKPFLDWSKISGEKENPVMFEAVKGKHSLVIVPYVIASKKHPLVAQGDRKVGDLDYMLDIHIHRYMGPGNADVVCPRENYGKECPICDEMFELYRQAKDAGGDKKIKEAAKKLSATRRVLYNVLVCEKLGKDEWETDGKLQVFHESHYLFEKEMIEAAVEESEDGNPLPFFELEEEGMVVSFRNTPEELGTRMVNKFKNFVFAERDDALVKIVNDDLVDEAYQLDKGIITMNKDELSELLYSAGTQVEDEEDDDEEETPKPRRRSKPEPEEDEEEEEEPPKRTRRAKPEPEEDEDEDEEPAPKRARRPKPEPEPEPEPEEDEEPEPVKRTRKPKAEAKADPACPVDGVFGDDHEKLDGCNDCPDEIWEACQARSQE